MLIMDIDMSTEHWDHGKCPKYDCKKDACKCGLKKVFLASVLGDDGKDSPIAPKNGAYCNAIVAYEANGHIYIYSSEGIPTLVETEGNGLEEAIKKLEDDLANEVTDRAAADNVLQTEIDDLKNSPDVVDIVPTYAALQAYDTSKLGDNDIIRVLQDETHDGQSTYYRWNKQSSAWTYIGTVGDYYTKGQVDTLLTGKQNTLTAGANVQISPENVISATDTTYTHFTGATSSADGTAGLVPAPVAGDDTKFLSGDGTWGTPAGTTYTAGTNVQISAQNVISATDTTYSAFTGTDGQTAGTAGLVPAPATTDAGKFLKADGSWDTVNAGPTVVQAIGDSTTDVMSQNAVARAIYDSADSTRGYRPKIGYQASTGGLQSVAFGDDAKAGGSNAVAVGGTTTANQNGAIALGYGAKTSSVGEMNIGTSSTSYGYNSTNYRLISGVHDPVNAHDAATKGYVDANAGGDTVYSDKTTSNSSTGGAVYIGNLDSNQDEQADPTSTDNHYKYFWALPSSNTQIPAASSVNILGESTGMQGVTIGLGSYGNNATYNTVIGSGAGAGSSAYGIVSVGFQAATSASNSIAIGRAAKINTPSYENSIALGSFAKATRKGELNIGTGGSNIGYNNTDYRVIGGVHDGQLANDAVTVGQVNSVIDAINAALSTNISHIGA